MSQKEAMKSFSIAEHIDPISHASGDFLGMLLCAFGFQRASI